MGKGIELSLSLLSPKSGNAWAFSSAFVIFGGYANLLKPYAGKGTAVLWYTFERLAAAVSKPHKKLFQKQE